MSLKSPPPFPTASRLEWRLWKCLVAGFVLALIGVKLLEWGQR